MRRFGGGLILLALVAASAFCGYHGIPFRLPAAAARPSAVDCRPTSIRLTAASDVLQTVYTLNAHLENWRGDLITSVRGWGDRHGCPATPSPTWSVDPPGALTVQPYFPNYAEFYPQTGARISKDYQITVRFQLADGDVLTQTKTLHIPPRRSRYDELARRILAGKPTDRKVK